MQNKNLFENINVKILLPFIVILGICIVLKSGYTFGQWLFAFTH
ncbi:MAG: hypothetical protein ABL929_10635 [Ferruginibacter sp.]